MRLSSITCFTALALGIPTSFSAEYVSTGSGLWDLGSPELWQLSDTSGTYGYPMTGSTDSVSILKDHVITFTGADSVGVPSSGDLGVAGEQTISIDGGILTQSPPNFSIRIGQESAGTVKINDGRWHFTDATGTANSTLYVGVLDGTGTINIGDGQGAAQSAVLNLRDRVDGSANFGAKSMNLGSNASSRAGVGRIVIHSDGLLEGDVRTGTTDNPVIRVGQASVGSPEQSSITVLAGGLFRAHGTVEIGSTGNATARSNGLIHLNGGTMEMDAGELNVGWDGNGTILVENSGMFYRNLPATKQDIYVGRDIDGVGNIILRSGGQFVRGPVGTTGDFYLGQNGTGNLTIEQDALFRNDATNWDWVGKEAGGKGTLTINQGGTFLTTAGSSLSVGYNVGSTGTILVNGGNFEMQGTAGRVILGTNGTATLRQISGQSDVRYMVLGETYGSGHFELQGGSFNVRSSFMVGGYTSTSPGEGSGTVLQSGGTLTIGAALSIGLATAHTGSLTMTGGTLYHTGSDLSVGENGAGRLIIGRDAVLESSSAGDVFVGRNNGSSGELYVDGQLNRTNSLSLIRVGAGDKSGAQTDAPGILGGDGIIQAAASGVMIGNRGTLTGGTLGSVGSLEIQGILSFSAGGKLTVDLNSSGEGDRINLLGMINVTDAILGGSWSGGTPSLGQPFWLVTNDETDEIFGRFANVTQESPYVHLFPEAEGWVSFGGQEFAVFYHADYEGETFTGGNDLALKAVPEPSAAMLLTGAVLFSLARRPRRRA